MGKKLKPVPEGNKGLKKLPTEVRNKMGFMRRGGKVTSSKNESGNNISNADRKKVKRLFIQESGKSISDADREKINQMMGKESGRGISDADRNKIAKMLGMKKGGLVKGGTSAQMTGKRYKGTF
jgi:hypothetical protein